MSVAQSYVICGCMTAGIAGVALLMISMGVFRRGTAAELDDAAARMLIIIGVGLIVALAAIWALGLRGKFY